MKKLNTLLFHQGGKCFYCDALLDLEEASIDHVIPQSKGGSNEIDNLVVCCKYANHAFADYSPKRKMTVMKQLSCFPSICKKIFPREKGITNCEAKIQSPIQSTAPALKPADSVQSSASLTTNNANSTSTTQNTSAAPLVENSSTTENTPTTPVKTASHQTKPDISIAYQKMLEAIDFFEQQGKDAISSQLKPQMLKLMPSFKESDYGFNQFSKFLLRAQEDKIVILKSLKKSGYTVKKKV
jgi:hypothetical protein